MIIEETEGLGGGSGGGGGGDGGNGGGFRPPSSSLHSGIRRCKPPGFLTKTFSIVNDPNTNPIISWSLTGTSFIIWDHLRFTADILGLYFDHNNFSSFVYQLNNYGFRKIGVNHQWEYENPNFQAGNQHLLLNIKRRNQDPHRTVTRRRPTHPDPNQNCSEVLRIEIDKSKLEIQELKRQQADMELQVAAIEANVKKIEKNSQKLITIWSEACDRILGQKIGEIGIGKDKSEIEAAIKKRKLDAIEEDDDRTRLVQEGNVDCEPAGLEENSGVYMYWTKMLFGDDEECENGGGAELADQMAEIQMDLERTITEIDGSKR